MVMNISISPPIYTETNLTEQEPIEHQEMLTHRRISFHYNENGVRLPNNSTVIEIDERRVNKDRCVKDFVLMGLALSLAVGLIFILTWLNIKY